MPRPYPRVSAAYGAYQSYMERGGETRVTEEQFLEELQRWLCSGYTALYIADREGRVRELKLQELFAAAERTDRALPDCVRPALTDSGFRMWLGEGGHLRCRLELLETLFALEDQGFRFLRATGEDSYAFVRFSAEDREQERSYAALAGQGGGWPAGDPFRREAYDRSCREAAALCQRERERGGIPPFDLPPPPRGETVRFAPALFGQELRGGPARPLLEAALRALSPGELGGRTRAQLVADALRQYEGAYLIGKDLQDGVKLELPAGADPEEEERLLEWLLRQEEGGCAILREDGDRRWALWETGGSRLGLRSREPVPPAAVERPNWFKRTFRGLYGGWRREVEAYERFQAAQESYLKGQEAYKQLLCGARGVPVDRADRQAGYSREERELADTLRSLYVQDPWEVTSYEALPPPPLDVGGEDSKEAAHRCLKGLEQGDFAAALNLVKQGLLYHNNCFRRADFRGECAERSCVCIRRGLALIETLRERDPARVEAWERGNDRGELSRLKTECRGALALGAYAAERRDSLERVLNTSPGSGERAQLLKEVLGPAAMAYSMRLRYTAALEKLTEPIHLREELEDCPASREQVLLGEDPERGAQVLRSWEDVSRTELFRTLLTMPPEALRGTLTGPEGRLRGEITFSACAELQELRAGERQKAEALREREQRKRLAHQLAEWEELDERLGPIQREREKRMTDLLRGIPPEEQGPEV